MSTKGIMSLAKYYDILGLSTSATSEEVSKRYKLLAKKYHPDINPSPLAKQQFIEIANAHGIILGKIKPPVGEYSAKRTSKKELSKEERIAQAKKRYEEKLKQERAAEERYYNSLFIGRKWLILKVSSLLGGILVLLMTLDIFLPQHYENQTVVLDSTSEYFGSNSQYYQQIITDKGDALWVEKSTRKKAEEVKQIVVSKSWVFHQPTSIFFQTQNASLESQNGFPVYFNAREIWFVLICVFSLPLFVRFYKRQKVWYSFLYTLALYVSSSAILLFLLINDHWAHALVFGFW